MGVHEILGLVKGKNKTSVGPSSNKNTMFAIYEKKTEPLDFYPPLRAYAVINFSESDVRNLEDDLQTLNQMRSCLESPPPSLAARCEHSKTYFKALCALESRFPISPNRDHINSVTFTWYDAFKTESKTSQQNIHLEKAAVLFNLGSVYSQIALTFDLSSSDGRKQAAHNFQLSAGAFAFLRENASIKASNVSSSTPDVTAECVGMLERLMLAQAQEIAFRSAVAKGCTPGACSKISRQVGLYYEEALAALNVAPLQEHFHKAWLAHVQLKAALFNAEACYRYSLELLEERQITEGIVRLTNGVSALSEAKKSSSKWAAQQLLDAIKELKGNLKCNLEKALKDNNIIYKMSNYATSSSLAPLPAFSMVCSTPMNELLDASKEKMFASLVTHSIAKALSSYTEMVDEKIRTQAEILQQRSELNSVRLKEMNLPDSILALEGNSSLPTALKKDAEEVQIDGGLASLEDMLPRLRDLMKVNQELLRQIKELLQKEATEDLEFRSQLGKQWTRPQSSALTKNLQDKLNTIAEDLKQAAESDARIMHSLAFHSALISIFDCHPIESALPTLGRPIMSLDANEDAIVGALKQSLRHLKTLGAQRADLVDMLKDMKGKDNILPKLTTSTDSYKDLLGKEIAKYDPICEEIAQNIEEQKQLLLKIQAQNDNFAAIFNIEHYKASCEKCYKQIEAAIAKFREIKVDIIQELKISATLQDAITNVKQQCSDFVATRNIACREMIEDVQRQRAGLSFQDGKNTGTYNDPEVQQHRQPQQSPSQQQADPENVLNKSSSGKDSKSTAPTTKNKSSFVEGPTKSTALTSKNKSSYGEDSTKSTAPTTKNKSSSGEDSTKSTAPKTKNKSSSGEGSTTSTTPTTKAPQTSAVSPISTPTVTAPQAPVAILAPPTPALAPAPVAAPISSVTAASEPDVYCGNAASNLVVGNILDMGGGIWDKDTVVRALHAANNNPERAVDYLYSGIPEQAEFPPVAQPPPSGQAANPQTRLAAAMPQAVTVTPEEHDAIERLQAMGFCRKVVSEVFFTCNKNEELAANYLLDHMHEF